MQQTETYKLNLIETSDPFSPEPLNENTQAIDAAMAAFPHVAFGTYTGDGTKDRFIELPFTPKVIYIGFAQTGFSFSSGVGGSYYYGGWAFSGKPAAVNSRTFVETAEGGMKVSHFGQIAVSGTSITYATANENTVTYCYFALG